MNDELIPSYDIYAQKLFPFIGQFNVLSILCENLLTQLIKGNKESIRELYEEVFKRKISIFISEFYNKTYKIKFQKDFPNYNIETELEYLRDLRNKLMHGFPQINENTLSLAKVSDNILETGENDTEIICEININDFTRILRRASALNIMLIHILKIEGRLPLIKL